ncbi:MAG: transaldolase family protein, partial [Ktedonobacteraceae bacterium]
MEPQKLAPSGTSGTHAEHIFEHNVEAATMTESRLHEVSQLGQSIWYDNIQRRLITSGDLQRLIDEDAVVGVTSNPTIFEKAIDGSADYDDQLKELVGQGVTDPKQLFDALSIHDIQAAA